MRLIYWAFFSWCGLQNNNWQFYNECMIHYFSCHPAILCYFLNNDLFLLWNYIHRNECWVTHFTWQAAFNGSLSNLMYDVVNKIVPPNLCSLFTQVNEVHHYTTRSSTSKKLFPKPSRLNIQLNSFSRLGVRLWNSIPYDIREMSKKRFKNSLLNKLFCFLEKEELYIDVSGCIRLFQK